MPSIETRVYLGIDPGVNGGLSWIRNRVVSTSKMPESNEEILFLLRKLKWEGVVEAVIEKVWGYVGKGSAGPHMFKLGANYGSLKMALLASDISLIEECPPRNWQKSLGIDPRIKNRKDKKGETDTEWKNRLKRKAQQLFPEIKVTLATADSLLIAEYCRRLSVSRRTGVRDAEASRQVESRSRRVRTTS